MSARQSCASSSVISRPTRRGEGEEAGQRAFQHADIGGDAVGQEFQHAVGHDKAAILAAVDIDLLLQDAEAQFVIGGVQVDDQPALQARLDAVFQILDLARRAVGGNHDLLVLIDQGVEGVEEFFLRANPCRR